MVMRKMDSKAPPCRKCCRWSRNITPMGNSIQIVARLSWDRFSIARIFVPRISPFFLFRKKLSFQDFEQDEEDSRPDVHFTEEDGTEGLSPLRRPRSSNPMAGLLPVEETGSDTHILIDEIGDNRAHALSL